MVALAPAYEDFARGWEAGENQIVYARLAADLDTPVSLMLKLAGPSRDASRRYRASESGSRSRRSGFVPGASAHEEWPPTRAASSRSPRARRHQLRRAGYWALTRSGRNEAASRR
jgi:hypothetical protein